MDSLRQDLKFAIRSLRKSPAFTLVAVFALALGIGANTAIFSVVNAVMLRPLPFSEPDRLVIVSDNLSWPQFKDWSAQSHALSKLGLYATDGVTLTGAGDPVRLEAAYVTDEVFPLLGVSPVLGRSFEPRDPGPQPNRVAIISSSLWERRFGKSQDVLGKTMVIEGDVYSIVGVMPRGFRFPIDSDAQEIWLPIGASAFHASNLENRGAHLFTSIGKLAPGVALETARAELQGIVDRLHKQYPQDDRDDVLVMKRAQDVLVGDTRLPLMFLTGAVAFVLLIACANVANLMLARALSRQRELTVRAALGASRRRLVTQLLVEATLLSVSAAVIGVLLCAWGLDVLGAALPESLRQIHAVELSGPVLAFTLGVTALTAVGFGLLPAFLASRTQLHGALKNAGRSDGTRGHHRIRGALVIGEIAVAMVLLIGGSLLGLSFWRAIHQSPGYDPANVTVTKLALPDRKYPEGADNFRFIDALQQRLAARPGVEGAAIALPLPLSGSQISLGVNVEGRDPSERLGENYGAVTAGYFEVLKIPLLEGRAFTSADIQGAENVMVVSRAFVDKYWPGQSAIGKHLGIGYGERIPRTVVGVVGDVRRPGAEVKAAPMMYAPMAQTPWPFMGVAVRSALPASAIAAMIREEVAGLDRDLAIPMVRTMEQALSESMAARRFTLALLGIFAAVALLLAITGIYGVIAYSVSQRTREVGIRMALGATAGSVVRLVLREGFVLAVAGIAIGIAGAVALTRFIQSLLYETRPTEPAAYAALAVVVAGVTLLACWIPARRAARTDPLNSLRAE